MKIYFVRHGKTQGNLEQRYNGIIDEPLVKDGIDELETRKDIYKDVKFDYIYCSPLTRCQQTFAILFPNYQVNEYRPDLVEMDFGSWAGISYADKLKELESQGYTWNDYVDPENGETYESLFNRTTNFLEEIKAKHNSAETILVLAHGLVIASVMKKHFLPDEIMYFLSPDNGLGYIIDLNDNEVNIKKIAPLQ